LLLDDFKSMSWPIAQRRNPTYVCYAQVEMREPVSFQKFAVHISHHRSEQVVRQRADWEGAGSREHLPVGERFDFDQ
jgi:hypothetical protein